MRDIHGAALTLAEGAQIRLALLHIVDRRCAPVDAALVWIPIKAEDSIQQRHAHDDHIVEVKVALRVSPQPLDRYLHHP